MIRSYDTPFVMSEVKGSVKEMRSYCMRWLDLWLSLELKRGKKGCIIFDIDATVIEENRDETVIKEVSNLYRKYRNIVPCIFVTARPNVRGNKAATEKMLLERDLGGYAELDLLDPGTDPFKFKFSKRNEYARKYGKVLARIGDQVWDSLAPPRSFKGDFKELENIRQEQCFIIFHPKLTEVSIKLPATM